MRTCAAKYTLTCLFEQDHSHAKNASQHLEGISYLTPVDPKREAFLFACHNRRNSKPLGVTQIEVANRLNKALLPYRGAQVFPALLTGEAQVYFGPLLSSIEYVRAGNFRALAVTTVARSPILPDVPALGETLPGYEASAWFGICGPKRTPEDVIEKLNKEVNVSIADPKLQARLANLGGTALGGSPADFAKLISDEVKKWSRVILAANMKRE